MMLEYRHRACQYRCRVSLHCLHSSRAYEPPTFEYIPSSPSNRISRSPSIANNLHSLRYPPSRIVEELPNLNEESDMEDDQSEISMNVDDVSASQRRRSI